MANIIDFNKYTKRKTIAVDDSDMAAMFEAFFKIPFNIMTVTDDDGWGIGFAALIGTPDHDSGIADDAAAVWDAAFNGRVFASVAAILTTYMDCHLEQQELNATEAQD